MRIETAGIGLWRDCQHFIGRALAVSESEYTTGDLYEAVAHGEATLLVHKRDGRVAGAAVVEIHKTPRFWILHVLAMGGRQVVTHEGYAALAAYARSQGCAKVQGWCKLPQARLYGRIGMQPAYIVMRGNV